MLTQEVLALLNNWDAPALHSCWNCEQFAAGAAPGVPCYECRDAVQTQADRDEARHEEAEAEYWRNLPVGGHD